MGLLDDIVDPIDRIVSWGVYSRGNSLRASGRLFISTEKAQQIYDQTEDDMIAVEVAIGRPLPAAREHLKNIRDDSWAGVHEPDNPEGVWCCDYHRDSWKYSDA